MDKNDIIEYVMTTPHNTNRAVLNSMLNQLAEGDSGGGSSDFHTATVTVEYIMPEGVSDVGELTKVSVTSSAIQYNYCEDGIPISDLGTQNQMNIPLYKNYPANLQIDFDNSNYYSVGGDSQVVSGDATITEGGSFQITGDCSLRVALIAND